jgi:hypothetical protein
MSLQKKFILKKMGKQCIGFDQKNQIKSNQIQNI